MSYFTIPAKSLNWSFSHSSGPGGQGVNTSSSRVQLECDLSLLDASEETIAKLIDALGPTVRVSSQSERSQRLNRQLCLEKLEVRFKEALKEKKPRKATRVPQGVKARRRALKQLQSELKRGRRAKFDY